MRFPKVGRHGFWFTRSTPWPVPPYSPSFRLTQAVSSLLVSIGGKRGEGEMLGKDITCISLRKVEGFPLLHSFSSNRAPESSVRKERPGWFANDIQLLLMLGLLSQQQWLGLLCFQTRNGSPLRYFATVLATHFSELGKKGICFSVTEEEYRKNMVRILLPLYIDSSVEGGRICSGTNSQSTELSTRWEPFVFCWMCWFSNINMNCLEWWDIFNWHMMRACVYL